MSAESSGTSLSGCQAAQSARRASPAARSAWTGGDGVMRQARTRSVERKGWPEEPKKEPKEEPKEEIDRTSYNSTGPARGRFPLPAGPGAAKLGPNHAPL